MGIVALLLMLIAVGDAGLQPGDHTRTVSLKGVHRSYLVHVPPQYDPATPMPAVRRSRTTSPF